MKKTIQTLVYSLKRVGLVVSLPFILVMLNIIYLVGLLEIYFN